jgi:hypothetical protein
MPIDPISAFELARTLFAGISAAAAAIGVWQKSRDKKEAAAAFDKAYVEERESSRSKDAAQELLSIIPPDVVVGLESRADLCWTGYRTVLGGQYLPDEVDRATDAVQACVCRELRRLYKLSGQIPSRWKGQWERYKCADRAA